MKTVPSAYNLFNVLRGRDWSYPHMQMNSYSLDRLGRLLADAEECSSGTPASYPSFPPRQSYDGALIVFRKG